jgi:hypothetical protein
MCSKASQAIADPFIRVVPGMVRIGPEVPELEIPEGWCEKAIDEPVSKNPTDAAAEHANLPAFMRRV